MKNFNEEVLRFFSANQESLTYRLGQQKSHQGIISTVDKDTIFFFADVAGVFDREPYDEEAATCENYEILKQAYEDLKSLGQEKHLADLYAARMRNMRPTGQRYKNCYRDEKLIGLFNGCGPQREKSYFNVTVQPEDQADLITPSVKLSPEVFQISCDQNIFSMNILKQYIREGLSSDERAGLEWKSQERSLTFFAVSWDYFAERDVHRKKSYPVLEDDMKCLISSAEQAFYDGKSKTINRHGIRSVSENYQDKVKNKYKPRISFHA